MSKRGTQKDGTIAICKHPRGGVGGKGNCGKKTAHSYWRTVLIRWWLMKDMPVFCSITAVLLYSDAHKDPRARSHDCVSPPPTHPPTMLCDIFIHTFFPFQFEPVSIIPKLRLLSLPPSIDSSILIRYSSYLISDSVLRNEERGWLIQHAQQLHS